MPSVKIQRYNINTSITNHATINRAYGGIYGLSTKSFTTWGNWGSTDAQGGNRAIWQASGYIDLVTFQSLNV